MARALYYTYPSLVHTGNTLEEFLKGYPSVSREQAEAVIEWASSLVESISKGYEDIAG